MRERARRRVRELLHTHQPTPPLPPVDAAIRDRFDILRPVEPATDPADASTGG